MEHAARGHLNKFVH